jgi:hypothetical protein
MSILKKLFGSKSFPGQERPRTSIGDRERKDEAEHLVGELIRIGKDVSVIRSYGSSESQRVGASGFVRPPEQGNVDARARAIGKRLQVIGGQSLMLEAHQRVTNELGIEAGRELAVCWNGVGTWTHKGEPSQGVQQTTKSENLRALEERLGIDPDFARATAQSDGENLLHWTPQLTAEERRAATTAAVALSAGFQRASIGIMQGPQAKKPQEGNPAKGGEECYICKGHTLERRYSPREITSKEPEFRGGSREHFIKVAALFGVADGIVKFDNPKGASDTPLWWICSNCRRNFF